jgi:hypothetical protein
MNSTCAPTVVTHTLVTILKALILLQSVQLEMAIKLVKEYDNIIWCV